MCISTYATFIQIQVQLLFNSAIITLIQCCTTVGMIITHVITIIYPITYSIKVIDCFPDHQL